LLLREQSDHRHVRVGAFYRRRALRLFPVIVAFVVAYVVFAGITHQAGGTEGSSIQAILLYYANWKVIFWPPMAVATGHLWSLAVEEQFYLLWPLAVAIVTVRARLRTVLLVYVPIIILVGVHRALIFSDGSGFLRAYAGTDTRIDTLLIGALLAHLWVRGRVPKRGLIVGATLFVVVLAVCTRRCRLMSPNLFRGGFTAIAVGVAVVLAAILETSWFGTRVLNARPLRAIGRGSYGIYVWHLLVFRIVKRNTTGWPFSERLLTALAATALVAYASWTAIERPVIRWKNRREGPVESRRLGTVQPG
jgi:peptidoglycan/LPS O-acetylase OafA/YrhL